MAFAAIKRAIMNAKFRKVNKHYATDYIFGERTYIPRKGKDPVEVLLYYPSKMENMPVFVQIHGGAWVGMDAVDDDRYCQRLSEELGAFVVNVNYKRLYDKSFPYPQEEVVDTVKWLNGTHTANRGDLISTVLRKEWGFEGIVMTDWGTTNDKFNLGVYGSSSPALCIKAGNDLMMSGSKEDVEGTLNHIKYNFDVLERDYLPEEKDPRWEENPER